jgi:hypothetical protein
MPACKNCSKNFKVTKTHLEYYKKLNVPEPTLCPTCRMQRRLAYRNDRSLYKTKSALSEKSIITMYDPANDYVVYDQKEWWSDKWDPFEYGRDFDFNRSFADQFADLRKVVPRFNVFNKDTENCEFVNYAPHCKNCYLIFGSWFNEDCLYGQTLNECKNCVDNLFLDKSELCYENIDSNNNYKSFFCQNCSNLADCYFCYDCKNCQNCIGCWNLRNKNYHIFNQPVSKEKFEEEKNKFSSYKTLEEIKKNFDESIQEKAVHKNYTGQNNESVSGDFIFNCKNAEYCFSVYRGHDIAFSARAFELIDSYDFEGGGKSELVYENMSNDFSHTSIGCTTCEHMYNAHYSDLCFNCTDCFGCIGLRHKKYCILNKQYSKEDYESLLKRIIEHMRKTGEWGEFPSISYSPFAYNETLAQEYFPITKEEAQKKGYKWKDLEKKEKKHQIYEIPDDIKDVSDSIMKEILLCSSCGKNFKIVQTEFDFYKRMKLPIPRVCSDCRHSQRMKKRTPRLIWDRKCDKCNASIKTAYAPERSEVYCEKCYLEEIV